MRLLLLSAIICLVLGSSDAQVRFNVNLGLSSQLVGGHSGHGHYFIHKRIIPYNRVYIRPNYYPERIRIYSNRNDNPYYNQNNGRNERPDNQNRNQDNGLNQRPDDRNLNQDNRINQRPDDRNLNQNNGTNEIYQDRNNEPKENVTKDRYNYRDDKQDDNPNGK